jgi:TldD protein
LSQDLVDYAIGVAGSSRCEYSEARYQKTSSVDCFTRNGSSEPAGIVEAEGIGVRIIYDGALAFGATNVLTQDNIKNLVEKLVKNARAAASVTREKIDFSREDTHREKWGVAEGKRLEDVSVESMISFLKEIDKTLSQPIGDVSFPNRNLFIGYDIEEKYFANSEGSKLEAKVPRVSYSGTIVCMYGGKPITITIPPGYSGLGGTGGWEVIDNLCLTEFVPSELRKMMPGIRASAKPPNDESLDLILGPNVAGLTSHESCGHPGEADRILGREGAQAGESFLKPDKLGMQIGSSEAYVSDDPTIPNSMGFYLYDDEGVKARKRRLITAGRFTEFLQNRATAFYFKIKSNGSSRAVRFDREPIIRMGNTFIEPGDWSFEEMLGEIKRGIYIKSFMEWNIDDKRLNQRYVGLEAFMIQNGKLGEAIKDPVFEITTPKYWGSIDARAKDIAYTCGTCGKGDPMQGAPVFFGAPHIRLRNVRVGSR